MLVTLDLIRSTFEGLIKPQYYENTLPKQEIFVSTQIVRYVEGRVNNIIKTLFLIESLVIMQARIIGKYDRQASDSPVEKIEEIPVKNHNQFLLS